MLSERELIREITSIATVRPGVHIGIGDDAAVLATTPRVVVAHDMLVEGVHFTRTTASFADIGYKALAVNLSDLAAMGADPLAALVGIGLPGDVAAEDARAFFTAMEALAEAHGITIAGGDVSVSAAITVGVTALGTLPDDRSPVLRSGARPGDVLCVTGALGGSAAGLRVLQNPKLMASRRAEPLRRRHRRPTPRVAAGVFLAEVGATAMIDCSDGLVLDASRIAEASEVAIAIRLEQVPLDDNIGDVAAASGSEADVFAATGGEDYELIVSLPPDRLEIARRGLNLPLTPVGECREGPAGLTVSREGTDITIDSPGWEHGSRR